VNWEAVGALAELAGAVGVVLTLVYLSTQIRQTNKLVSSSISVANREARDGFARLIAADDNASRIMRLGLQGLAELSEDEVSRFFAQLTVSTSAQLQEFELSGTVGPQWKSIYSSLGFREWWPVYSEAYPPEFRECIDRLIDN